jgi:hypothetical protein
VAVADEVGAAVAELEAVVAELVDVLDELHADNAPPIVTKATPAVNERVSLDRHLSNICSLPCIGGETTDAKAVPPKVRSIISITDIPIGVQHRDR